MTPIVPIAVTGMGAISAIGNNVTENFRSLVDSKHGIAPIRQLDTWHRERLLAGEIHMDNAELYDRLQLSREAAYTRSTLLALMATKEAIETAAFKPGDGYRTGLISATTVGGMDATERYYDDYLVSEKNRSFIQTHPCGYAAEQMGKYFGVSDFITTISTACSSAANAIMLGARMIRAGQLDRAIVGGTDCLSRFTINGFNSLMIYTDGHCKPFDENRNGLNLGEAAAYLVLEAPEVARKRMKSPIAYLTGYGNANDAFHQTASSDNGEGAYLAMRRALEVSGLNPRDIDYVNAHGTATPNNDLAEGNALLRIYGSASAIPPFSSTKAFTGHTLAAAGAIEAVFSILALQHQVVFPNLNFSQPIASLGIVPQTALTEQRIDHVLSNSFGFGGNCSTLLFSKDHD
ncbi:beta-ketoacyl-[acyl-carrier-protein] synthase family protein [Parapedobacter indicus]|uniref:3-oxoacyl-[acyl-carrier-protein] synthase-1 n=1 Tax=Parapedobacter indicus TaxID=1477437 RepID=A0A1I3FIH9_9SPHI|nr:beta-ketoacyl-[acyl-carrier-protein] synthase family protein [Parapedobacter indicus]PPL03738.1 3-oxoacyl-[acyl-carrier-protein] synthase-1 [Parapedobacter indicus]SFI10922.1 3-oxoacyl-[acyl-carrier-protein] synthase-1 [Parapedobacter indicus]